MRTYNTIIAGCNMSGRYAEAVGVYARMRAAGAEPGPATHNAVLLALARTGQLDAALDLFRNRCVLGLGFGVGGPGCGRSCELLAGTHTSCLVNHLWLARLEGCELGAGADQLHPACLGSHADDSRTLVPVSVRMSSMRGSERGAHTYAAVLSACERPGRWDLAMELLGQMQREGLRPTTACLTSAINACLHGALRPRPAALPGSPWRRNLVLGP